MICGLQGGEPCRLPRRLPVPPGRRHLPRCTMRVLLFSLASFTFAPAASAADLRVYPSEVKLSGPNRTQQLLVVEEENGRTIRDLTGTAKYALPQGKGGPVVK